MSEFSRYAMVTIFIFLASCAAGVMVSSGDPGAGEQLLGLFREAIVGEILDSAPSVLALKLFVNNLQACTFMFLGGASLGLLTAFIILANGVVIGAVAELVRQQQGLVFVAAALAPHGIFEIPSFLIAGGLGFLLGQELIAEWHGRGDAAAGALPLARLFLRVVVPLLAVAAIVEAFITPAVLSVIT